MILDERLQKDSYALGFMESSRLLLSRNAHFPWFILVPDTRKTEFYELAKAQQHLLLEQINRLSAFISRHFSIDKLNVATIGNVVSQMHIHIVGRHHSDVCWPGVVWGNSQFQDYPDGEVESIRDKLELDLLEAFQATR
jgi:diadenosine tetraphosphate (Ap4A) HIT family hydrolase